MTRLAAANLHVHDAIGTAVLCDDVRDVNLAECDAWHLDPDRRPDARRRSTPDLCDPPLDQFLEIVEDRPHGAVKLSPAADATHLLDQGAELEWIGCRGECQQQVAWFGDLAQAPGARTAAWLTVNQHHDITDVDRLIERKDSAPTIATTSSHQFLFEPRPSILAAQLEDSLAMEFGMRKLASNLPILTSELAAKSNLFRRFRVVEILPFRKQPLREAIRRHGLCVTEVKKRGVDVSPENLLRELTRPQGSPCVVYLYPLAKAIQAAIVIRDDIRR